MSKWTVYRIANDAPQAVTVCENLEYHGSWMGECFVTFSVKSAEPVEFMIGDYVDYRGERFVLNYDPSVVKKARRGTYGEGFTYENIKFNARHTELTDIRFLDYVLADNNLHYTSLPEFPFYAATIDDFLDRLQANTNRWCEANGFILADYWLFLSPNLDRFKQRARLLRYNKTTEQWEGLSSQTAEEIWRAAYGAGTNIDDEKKDVSVSVNNQSIWDAMAMIKNDFGLNFINRGRQVIVGVAGLPTSMFRYGKDNGLYEIERVADTEQQVITKLYCYGSSKNLPVRYYANLGRKPVIQGTKDTIGTDFVAYIIKTDIPFADIEGLLLRADTNCTVSYGDYVWTVNVDGYMNGEVQYAALYLHHDYESHRDLDFYNAYVNGQPIYILSGVNVDTWKWFEYDQTLPNNMAVNKLMLPGFPNQSLYDWVKANGGTGCDDATGRATWRGYTAIFSKDKYQPYILSVNAETLGIREAVKNFDGSDGDEEIYPTIEGTGYDIITASEMITDNGVFAEGQDEPTFTLTLPFFGSDFNLEEQMKIGTQEGGSPTIYMKDGHCGSREFQILKATRNDNLTWACKCKREHDDLLDLWFPYSYNASIGQTPTASEVYQVRAGDKYVLTGIPMTETYVNANAVKLLEASLEYLSKNDYVRYTFIPRIDELYMARQHDEAIETDGRSLYLSIKEGDIMVFEDNDLNIDGQVFIDTLQIKENGNANIPTFEVTLRNDKQVGTIQRIQEQLSSLANSSGGGTGGSGGGVSANQLREFINTYGSDTFLSKKTDDTANGFITFVKGLWSKAEARIDGLLTALNIKSDNISSSNYTGDGMADTGWSITNSGANGRSKMVIDELYVRMKAVFEELEIKKRTVSGGDETWSEAANRIVRTDYIHVEDGEEEELGYSYYNMPWTLSGNKFMFALRRLSHIFGLKKKVRASLKSEDLSKINYVRCYFLAELDGQAVDNMWMTGDLARCQTFNLSAQSREGGVNPTNVPSEDGTGHYTRAQNTFWWRKVLHAADTENYQVKEIDGVKYHWFDVSYNDPNNEAAGSDLPCAGDAVSQFGNDHNPERMNVVCIEINGSANADAPCIKAYRGIYTFDLKQCWWGGQSCMKMKISPATGYQFYGPLFEFITEYGTEKVQQDRPEVYWSSIALDKDDEYHETYPEYSDDIVEEESRTRWNGTEMRNVRKCFYYDRVSHHGSVWLCVFPNDGFHWRVKVHKEGEPSNAFTYNSVTYNEGDIVPDNVYGYLSTENKTKCEHVRNYITDEPSDSSASWKKQVEKGDNGQFMSRAFCRTNLDISNVTPTGGTAQSPIPDAMTVEGQQIVWHDGAPDGLEMLWGTTAWFMPDGQHSQWTKPARETDTQTQDIEFSPNETKPNDPYGDDASQKDSSTYRTERHNQGWYDPTNDANSLPSGVTWSDMIWRAERKIKNGVYSGGWTVSRIKGESANRLDLDNEMDMIQTDSAGKVMVERTVSTIVRLFEGTKKVSMNVADVSVTVKNASGTTVTLNPTKNPSTGTTTDLTLSWTFSPDARMSSVYEITVKYTYKSVEYSAVFTVAASMGQPIYQLKPSHSSLPCTRNDDNTLSNPPALSLAIVKIDGASTDEITPSSYGLTYIRYTKGSSATMPSSVSDGDAWPPANTVQAANTDENVYIAMFNSSGKLIDRETIPVICDGKNGENSIRLALDNEHEDFIYSDAGLVAPSGGAKSAIHLYDGIQEKTTSATLKVYDDYRRTWENSTSSYASASASISNGTLTVSGLNVDSVKVRVRAEYPVNSNKFYYAEFTANKVSQDKYDLNLNPNAIAYNSASYDEQTIIISGTRTDLNGNKNTIGFAEATASGVNISSTTDKGIIRLWATYVVQVYSSVWEEVTVRVNSPSFSVTESIASHNDGIYFELRKYSNTNTRDDSETGYTICDYETVEIAKAENGDTIRSVEAFRRSKTVLSSSDVPTATTIEDDTTDVGNGWSTIPPEETGLQSIDFSEATESWVSISGQEITISGGDQHSISRSAKIRFITAKPNVSVSVKLTVSTEENYDYGYIGNLDTSNFTSSYKSKLSGDNTATVTFDVSTEGEHYFILAYTKDGSRSGTYDNVKAKILTIVDDGAIYVSTATFKNGNIVIPSGKTSGWSNPVQWSGKNGDKGEQGKMGRNFYYRGEWSDTTNKDYIDADDVISATDYETPYVSNTVNGATNYYVWVGENVNNNTTKRDFTDIPGSSDKWEHMTSQFKFLITEALFTGDAHLGSWVFNNDYFFTEGGSNNNWTSFAGLTSDSKMSSGFIPNIAMDAAKGRASFARDKVRFNPSGNGWLANGNISWNDSGTLTVTGTINATGGSITGDMIVGTDTGKHIIITNNNNNYGSAIIGKDGASRWFSLGFSYNQESGYKPQFILGLRNDSGTYSGNYIFMTDSWFEQHITGNMYMASGNIHNSNILDNNIMGTMYQHLGNSLEIGITENGKAYMYSDNWETDYGKVPARGGVYLGGDGCLHVRDN